MASNVRQKPNARGLLLLAGARKRSHKWLLSRSLCYFHEQLQDNVELASRRHKVRVRATISSCLRLSLANRLVEIRTFYSKLLAWLSLIKTV